MSPAKVITSQPEDDAEDFSPVSNAASLPVGSVRSPGSPSPVHLSASERSNSTFAFQEDYEADFEEEPDIPAGTSVGIAPWLWRTTWFGFVWICLSFFEFFERQQESRFGLSSWLPGHFKHTFPWAFSFVWNILDWTDLWCLNGSSMYTAEDRISPFHFCTDLFQAQSPSASLLSPSRSFLEALVTADRAMYHNPRKG